MTAHDTHGLTLVLGPPNSGKRGLALDWWQERLQSRPLVVMPTASDAAEMSAELARRMGGLVGHSRSLTFAGLAQAIDPRPLELIDEFERTVLIQRLLRSTRLQALGEVTHLPGLAGAAAAALRELSEGGRTGEELDRILEGWAKSDRSSARLARDVRLLLTSYREETERLGLVDQARLVQEVAATTDGWTRPVAFCGFTSFTEGQRGLVQRLSGQTETLVTLDFERERGVGLCTRAEVDGWTEHATLVIDVAPHSKTYASASVARLEHCLLEGDASEEGAPADSDSEGVRFLLSSGRRAEAESVAKHIALLMRDGFDPGGIAVVVRQVRTWGRLLGDVFASCGIPYGSDELPTLGETGLGYAFIQAVRGVAFDDAESLLFFLRSPYSGAHAEDVRDLEARYRQGASRGMGALADLAGRRMADIIERLGGLLRRASGRRSGDEESRGVQSKSDAPRRLDVSAAEALAGRMMLAAAAGADVGDPELEADARAHKTLCDALAVVSRHVGPSEPAAILRLLAQATVLAGSQHATGRVQIISAQRARARRFDAVFVLGLVEGEFPGPADVPSLLSGDQRARLASLGAGLSALEPGAERKLFIGAATRAWQVLYLSARDAEDDGSEALPSRFWTEAKSLLGAEALAHERRTLADQVFEVESAPSLRHYLRACVAAGGPLQVQDFTSTSWQRGPAVLTSSDVVTELQAKECFSPSALESYARCPFAWFVERVVGTEDSEAELDSQVLGDLIHGVLRECYRSLAADSLLPLRGELVPEAQARADALIDAAVSSGECPGSPGERRLAASRLRRMAERLFQAEAAAGGSVVFSEAETWVGGTEGEDVGGLRVRGRVDRIDTTSDGRGLFVLDYKSGAAPELSKIGTAEGLQLPLYLLALGAERPDQEVLGGAYVSLKEGAVSGVASSGKEGLLGTRLGKLGSLDTAAWQELAEEVLRVAKDAAQGMRSGAIGPRADGDCPDWCELGPVCRSRKGGRR